MSLRFPPLSRTTEGEAPALSPQLHTTQHQDSEAAASGPKLRGVVRVAAQGLYAIGLSVGLSLAASSAFAQTDDAAQPTPEADAPVTGADSGDETVRGGDFSFREFESAQFNEQVKQLQAQKSKIRTDSINKLEDLLRRNPYYAGKADVYFRLAEFYWDEQKYQYLLLRDQYDKQYEQFERGTLTTEPNEPREDFSTSLGYYRKILQEFPDYPRIDEVIYYLGRGALSQGKDLKDRELTKEGVGYFQKLVQNYPQSRFIAESHLALAEHYFENNSLYYAKTNYEKIINNYKDSPMFNYALYKLGWVYFNLAEFRKSINTFKEVVEIVGAVGTQGMIEFRGQALKDLVVCFAEVDDGWKEAREYFIDKVGEEDAYKKLRSLAELYVGQDKDDEAIELYRHFIEYKPNDAAIPEYFDNIITVLAKLNDFPNRESTIREMVKFFDKRNTWWAANKSNAEASEAADKMVETNLLFLANFYHKAAEKDNKRQDFEQAATDYAQYLDLFPDSKNAYLVNFYYAEILYDPIEDFEKAIEQYNAVIKRDTGGDYVEDAALGVIYSYEALLRKQGLREDTGGKIKVVKLSAKEIEERAGEIPRTELHELERGYVDAADLYVKLLSDLIKDPEVRKKNPERGERIPEIMYVAAKVFYDHGQYKEALTRLKTIFDYDDQSEFAAYAVNTMLDCYVRLRYWEEIDQWATNLIDAKNFTVKSKRALNRIRAIAKAEKARDLTLEGKYGEAVDENMSVYKEFKKENKELASKALYNVGAIHERAKRYPDAIKAYLRVVKEFPKEEIAPTAMVTIGQIYESQTEFEKAADTLEKMTKFPDHPMTPEAIQEAALIREALRDYDGAVDTHKLYIKKYKTRDDVPAVERQIGIVYESMGTASGLEKAAKHFEKLAKKYSRSPDQKDLVVEAYSRAGQDIKKATEMRVEAGENIKDRSIKKKRKAATKLLNASLKAFAEIANPAAAKSRPFAAAAALQLSEYIYSDFLGSPVDTASFSKLKRTLTAKAELQQKSENSYADVLNYKSGGSTACALFRIGQLYYDFGKALFDVPIPEELPIEMQDEYMFALEQMAAPLEEKSLTAFKFALDLALQQGVYNDCSKSSADYAAKVNPDLFPVSNEDAVQPNHEKDTLLSANFIRSLRRGEVEVEFVTIEVDEPFKKSEEQDAPTLPTNQPEGGQPQGGQPQ